jgi:hypothetical protein
MKWNKAYEIVLISLCDCVPVYVSPSNNFWMPEAVYIKVGIYIVASGHGSRAV